MKRCWLISVDALPVSSQGSPLNHTANWSVCRALPWAAGMLLKTRVEVGVLIDINVMQSRDADGVDRLTIIYPLPDITALVVGP